MIWKPGKERDEAGGYEWPGRNKEWEADRRRVVELQAEKDKKAAEFPRPFSAERHLTEPAGAKLRNLSMTLGLWLRNAPEGSTDGMIVVPIDEVMQANRRVAEVVAQLEAVQASAAEDVVKNKQGRRQWHNIDLLIRRVRTWL